MYSKAPAPPTTPAFFPVHFALYGAALVRVNSPLFLFNQKRLFVLFSFQEVLITERLQTTFHATRYDKQAQ